ncbi:hypothetical protein E2C01_009390 [Portunus trituberculatus]|uniref:Uncharacterized protein n=1 Tax=Portunus trituberculatus TaxID=210409 RepID=A0A5B7D4X1_PORTR|nr:hypothetical protein [Portunus trituberculatus]
MNRTAKHTTQDSGPVRFQIGFDVILLFLFIRKYYRIPPKSSDSQLYTVNSVKIEMFMILNVYLSAREQVLLCVFHKDVVRKSCWPTYDTLVW